MLIIVLISPYSLTPTIKKYLYFTSFIVLIIVFQYCINSVSFHSTVNPWFDSRKLARISIFGQRSLFHGHKQFWWRVLFFRNFLIGKPSSSKLLKYLLLFNISVYCSVDLSYSVLRACVPAVKVYAPFFHSSSRFPILLSERFIEVLNRRATEFDIRSP